MDKGVVMQEIKNPEVKTDEPLIRALVQFWNPRYSCFTFNREDMVPTIEEYTTLLHYENITLERAYIKHIKSQHFKNTLARVSGVDEKWVIDRTQRRGSGEGIEWIHIRSGGGRFVACVQLLQVWIHSHFWKTNGVAYRRFSITYSPLEEFIIMKWLEAPWLFLDDVLFRCEDSDTITLLGLWGAIGYAPLLELRQYGARQFPARDMLTPDYMEWRRLRKNDNIPVPDCEDTRTMEEHLRSVPSGLEIARAEFEAVNNELNQRIKELEAERYQWKLDADSQKDRANKLEREQKRVCFELEDLKKGYQDKVKDNSKLKVTSEYWKDEAHSLKRKFKGPDEKKHHEKDGKTIAELEAIVDGFKRQANELQIVPFDGELQWRFRWEQAQQRVRARDVTIRDLLEQVQKAARHLHSLTREAGVVRQGIQPVTDKGIRLVNLLEAVRGLEDLVRMLPPQALDTHHPHNTRAKKRQIENSQSIMESIKKSHESLVDQIVAKLSGLQPQASAPRAGASEGTSAANPDNHPDDCPIPNFDEEDKTKKMEEKIRMLEDQIKMAQGDHDYYGVDAIELSLVPDLVLPPKFKVPEFEKFDGNSCPSAHITMFCWKMTGYGGNDQLLIHCFQESLSGSAIWWYNQLSRTHTKTWKDLAKSFLEQYKYINDMRPDRVMLQSLEKKHNESDPGKKPPMKNKDREINNINTYKANKGVTVSSSKITAAVPSASNVAQNPLPNHLQTEINAITTENGNRVKICVSEVKAPLAWGHNVQECPEFISLVQLMMDRKELEFYEEIQDSSEEDVCPIEESSDKRYDRGGPLIITPKVKTITTTQARVVITAPRPFQYKDNRQVPRKYECQVSTSKRCDDDEIPSGGRGRTKALHIAIYCKGHALPSVLINNISALNVIPLVTLKMLPIDTSYMRSCQNVVQAFDGTKREVVGKIEVPLTVGPATYDVEFLVMDIMPSYNCLLGRLWIHQAGAVPSTLHQKVKFVIDGSSVIINAEEDIVASVTTEAPYIEVDEEAVEFSFRSLEFVNATFVTEGRRIPKPRLSNYHEKRKEIQKNRKRRLAKLTGGELQREPMAFPPLYHTFKSEDVNNEDRSGICPLPPGFVPSSWSLEELPMVYKNLSESPDNDNVGIDDLYPKVDFESAICFGEFYECDTEDECNLPTKLLRMEYRDVFAWPYQDMSGLDTDMGVHQLPIKPELAKYPEWVANIVPVPKKDGKVRMCVDYRDLNKASPKDNFPLPHINTLVDNIAGNAFFSFMDGFFGYNQIKMHLEDMEKTTFVTIWGTFCYKVMPFGLKNAGATYQRTMVTLFHDMMHKKLRFVVSRKGIEVDPNKVKAIQSLPPPRTQKEVRGQHDESEKKERAIYYLSKKFTDCEVRYSPIKKVCCALVWATKRLRQYMLLARWQMLLSEFNIEYVSQKVVKGSAISEFLAKEASTSTNSSWRIHFDGASNALGHGVGAILISPEGNHYTFTSRLNFDCTNNMAEYEACVLGIRAALGQSIKTLRIYEDSAFVIYQLRGEWETKDTKLMEYQKIILDLLEEFDEVTFHYVPREENQMADALATLAAAFTAGGEFEMMPINIILSIGVIQKKPPKPIREPLEGWQLDTSLTERRCHKCQIYGDKINVPPHPLHVMTSPWPFSVWGMDVIGQIHPKTSNGHRFILVEIDYFTKWVEDASYASVTQFTICKFLNKEIICRYGLPERIITDNATNLNNKMMNAASYGMEVVLPIEVKIPSLRVLTEVKLDDAEWVQSRYDQLNLIDEKRLKAIHHGQIYQKRIIRAHDKKVRPRIFREGDLVLKRIWPVRKDFRGKWTPNWEGPYLVKKAFSGGALVLAEMDGPELPHPINSDAIKKYFT
ncbi:hypothetical protein F3Y22_tig00110890pilonHSYRG01710 [Hibiscus syriacus]|uniref:RNA-directed DNA polymerase n=1 Tax=Hibiscus syriacus TaxID=106335 RepID=A0A6A2ZHQ1_HIBSY|nr:hypothetical protein F3Y22_tig00110890pilonHSYRG01710 [Hibiscus syriacus]